MTATDGRYVSLLDILPDADRRVGGVLALWKGEDGGFNIEDTEGFYGGVLTADQVRRFALWLLEWIGDGAQPADPDVEGWGDWDW